MYTRRQEETLNRQKSPSANRLTDSSQNNVLDDIYKAFLSSLVLIEEDGTAFIVETTVSSRAHTLWVAVATIAANMNKFAVRVITIVFFFL